MPTVVLVAATWARCSSASLISRASMVGFCAGPVGACPRWSRSGQGARAFAGEHDKQSNEALDKAADFADDKTGGKYGSQIQSGEDKAENYLGVEDQDQQNQGNN